METQLFPKTERGVKNLGVKKRIAFRQPKGDIPLQGRSEKRKPPLFRDWQGTKKRLGAPRKKGKPISREGGEEKKKGGKPPNRKRKKREIFLVIEEKKRTLDQKRKRLMLGMPEKKRTDTNSTQGKRGGKDNLGLGWVRGGTWLGGANPVSEKKGGF